MQTDELAEPSPYPVILELLLPMQSPNLALYPEGHLFDLRYLEHRALILHARKTGSEREPAICLSVVPLAFDNYLDLDEKKIPLKPPHPLNVAATFPVLEEHREE